MSVSFEVEKYRRAVDYTYSNKEFCGLMTQGVTNRPDAQATKLDARKGGLREANWSYNVVMEAVKNPARELEIINTFLEIIQKWSKEPNPKEFFKYRCDYKGCCPIWVRTLAHLVDGIALPEFKDKLSTEAQQRILDVAEDYNKGQYSVDARLIDVAETRKNTEIVFPESECRELLETLRSEGGDISAKKCAKQILEITDEIIQRKLLIQYADKLKEHRDNPLVQKLLKKFPGNYEEYKDKLSPETKQICEALLSLCSKKSDKS